MKYTLRQLEVFLAAAHFQNITQAAQALNMSQSAASGALKTLEEQFEIQLFDRVGKRLQLNELGRVVRPKAEALMSHAADLESALHQHRDVGPISVGATLTIGNYLAVKLIAHFMQEHPDTKVSLEVANTTHIAQSVLNFDIDVGLVEGEVNHPDLEVIPWRNDELAVFCSPDHPLATKKHINDDDLAEATWILREPGSGTRQAFDWGMHGLIPSLHILLELQHTEAIKRAVEAGLGIGCLSQVALEDAFKRRSLIPLKLSNRSFKRQFYFVLHKHKYRSAGIENWLNLCRNQASDR